MLSQLQQLVGFDLAGQHYGVNLAAVERIVHVVEVAPLPQAPSIVLGVINFSGRIIPVVDLRRRFRLSGKEVGLYDSFLFRKFTKANCQVAPDIQHD